MYKLRAPASSANIGSGFDSIGIALNLYNYVTFEESDEILVECEDEVPKDGTNLIVDTVRKVYAQAGRTFRGLPMSSRKTTFPWSGDLAAAPPVLRRACRLRES